MPSRHDWIVDDAEDHACIMDGLRLSPAKRYVYQHNDMESLRKQLERATKWVENTGGGILVVTPVYLSGSVAEGTQVAMDLRENYNLFCSIVVYPVIPKGQLLLRLIPTAMHTLEDVEYTVKAFKNVAQKLANGEYNKDVVVDANAL